MSEPIWRKGPPPSIGWWPASTDRDPALIRWWNGIYWSNAAIKTDSIVLVEYLASVKSDAQNKIEWTDRPDSWPQRSKT